eukprot:760910-Hanusia_phi.AAC.2
MVRVAMLCQQLTGFTESNGRKSFGAEVWLHADAEVVNLVGGKLASCPSRQLPAPALAQLPPTRMHRSTSSRRTWRRR